MRSSLFGIVMIAIVWACVPKKSQNAEKQDFPLPDQSLSDPLKEVPKIQFKFSDIKIYQPISAFSASHFKKFGNFYSGDFSIYHINDLNALYENKEITEIYLYFIDSVLLKIQAHTTRNLTSELIKKYEGGKMIPKDKANKYIARNEPLVTRKKGQIVVNKKLNNYKIRWKNDDIIITYEVDDRITPEKTVETIPFPILSMPRYVFTFESSTYQQQLYNQKLRNIQGEEVLVYEQN